MPTTLVRDADWIVAHDGAAHRYASGDVAWTDDRLVHVGGRFAGEADRVIDGRGLMVMPGLVNVRSHPASEPMNKGFLDEFGSKGLYPSSLHEFMPLFRPDAEGARACARRRRPCTARRAGSRGMAIRCGMTGTRRRDARRRRRRWR